LQLNLDDLGFAGVLGGQGHAGQAGPAGWDETQGAVVIQGGRHGKQVRVGALNGPAPLPPSRVGRAGDDSVDEAAE
jgi:hypothetical protein